MIDPSRQLAPAPAWLERGINKLEMLPPHELAKIAEAFEGMRPWIKAISEFAQVLSDLAFFGVPQLPDDFDELKFRLEIVRAMQSNN